MEFMKKHNRVRRETHETLLVKFFFVIAVSVTALIAYGVLWFMWHSGGESYTPAISDITPPPALIDEDIAYLQVNVPPSRNISLCDVNLTIPELSIDSLNRLAGDFWNLSGFCGYKSDAFSVIVLDKNKVATTSPDTSQLRAFAAFDRYLSSQNPKEIIDIASTDTDFTTIFLRYYYSRIGKNTITYTGQIGQDSPGQGVYQTATYLDNRYIIYLTYHLFNNQGDPWNLYFNKNLKQSESGDNSAMLFKTYMDLMTIRPEVRSLIEEINASVKTTQVHK